MHGETSLTAQNGLSLTDHCCSWDGISDASNTGRQIVGVGLCARALEEQFRCWLRVTTLFANTQLIRSSNGIKYCEERHTCNTFATASHPLRQFVGNPLGTAAFWRGLSNPTPSVKAKVWSPIENEFDLESKL